MKLELGKDYKVRVVKYLRKGIIVRFIDEPAETAFIHLSQISPDFVDDVSKFVRLNDELVARAAYDPKFETQLTLKHLCLHASYEPAGMRSEKEKERKPRTIDSRLWNQPVIRPDTVVHVDSAIKADKTVVASTRVKSDKSDDSLDKMLKDADAHLAEKIKGRKQFNKRQTRRRG